MASLRMALSYDIDQERKGGDSLTDLDLNLKLTPYPYIDIGFDGGVNPGKWNVTRPGDFGINRPATDAPAIIGCRF